MALFETEGLILKSYNLSEADKIIVFLTQHHGLVKGVAKGAKRLKSRFGGSLEPFSIVSLNYYQKEERELVSIRGIDLLKSYFNLASEPVFLQKFAYLSELLIGFAPPHDPNERLYRMAKVCLESASENLKTLETITLYFELWLLRLGGYLPAWTNCDLCKRELGNETTGLQTNFQLLCRSCQKAKSNISITNIDREIFSQAQKMSPANFIEYAAERTDEVQKISQVLKRIISQILGKEILSERVLVAGL
jgi:DNA repair protein RecO (recombination protein O)